MRVVQSKWLMGPHGQGWSFQVSGATFMQHVIYVSIYKPLTMYVRSMHACSYMYVRSMHACMLLYWGCCHILGLLLSMHLIVFTITIYVLCCGGLRARTSPLLFVAVYSGCETMASVTMILVLFIWMQVVTCMQRSRKIFINLLQNIYLF
jgi:hypothetical protein